MDRVKTKYFWNMKAKRYPKPFSEKVYPKVMNLIERIKKAGVDVRNRKLLEIGCGTGLYTLPMAQEAFYVYGVDCSEEMGRVLLKEAENHGIKNIHIQIGFWDEMDIDALGFRKHFDLVFAIMTSAIKTQEDLLKMEACSKRWLCYVGWGRKRRNPLIEEVFKLHGLELQPPPGALRVYQILKGLGRHPSLEFFEDAWDWEGSIEEALEDLSSFVEMHGILSEKGKILEVLHRHEIGGYIKHTTSVEEGLMIWEVEG